MRTRGASGCVRKPPDGLARLHEQRLVALESAELADDDVEALPVPRRLAGAAVDDEVRRALGDLGIEVVVEHAEGRLLHPALAGDLRAARRAHDARSGHAASLDELAQGRQAGQGPRCGRSTLTGVQCNLKCGPEAADARFQYSPPRSRRSGPVRHASTSAAVPRRWFARSVIGTHMANGLNLLFPAGERFFVRSVRHYLERIDDPQLREDIKGFSGQEGLHAYAHERYFEALEKQGYEIRGFLKFYEKFAYGFVEKIAPAELRLAATAACEHFTATMAANALAREADGTMVVQDPTMRALFLWHAVEEIEHRAVAFDVLQAVNPNYELRVAGLAVAASLLFGLWMIAAGNAPGAGPREARSPCARAPRATRVPQTPRRAAVRRGDARVPAEGLSPAAGDGLRRSRARIRRRGRAVVRPSGRSRAQRNRARGRVRVHGRPRLRLTRRRRRGARPSDVEVIDPRLHERARTVLPPRATVTS